MKKSGLIVIVGIVAVVWSVSNTYAQGSGIDRFAWMVGAWAGEEEGGMFYENWTMLDDRAMSGTGFYVRGGDTVLTEELSIQRFGDHWAYVAVINGGAPVLFTLVESDAGRLVFENPEHDFPQRIVYTHPKEGELFAWIEGEMRGEAMRDEYRLKRVE